ncbi:alpha/beta hydrolase [Streptomyces sp. 549]|uniref:alpha/beta hydrolase n=1 Tax=Streptomyces sp. 549 TaxID=3049076 RepID=UPI0024C2E80E|nr:alpha/beta hydrolase [Streptomyces sp. 549]MDK1476319.1 alpha/beta hydrolase [Streptomyces sp. 549]
METRRLLRTSGVFLGAAVLLVAGCTSGDSSSPDGPESKDPPTSAEREAGTDKLLEPLPAAVPDELKPYYTQKLSWRDCGVQGFECSTMKAPLDYEDPDSASDLSLAVVRKRADGNGDRLGSLMVNPGGPGSSAVDFVQMAAGIGFPEKVRARYDIVGLDPRGVGRSEPVECLSDEEMDRHTQVDITPDSKQEVDELRTANDRFAAGCEKQAGDLLNHVSTVDAARDMDVLREVLGDDKLSYVGFSYGTFLGATYAGLFPSRAGRLVLDGAMDPSLSAEQLNRDQTAGFETAFTAFAEDCVERSDCPLGTKSAADAGKQLSAFFEKVDREPLETGEERKLGESLATTGVIRAMYDESAWATLRTALAEANRGEGAGLLALSDDYFERDADGSYDNIMYANAAVNCADQAPAFSTPEEVREAVPSFEKASPVFGRGFAWAALNCAAWKVEPSGEANRIEAKGADPILVVGTTRDPATPYVWSEGLAEQLDSASLLTYEGDGHTAYLRGGPCISDAVNDYLLEGKAPEDGKRCSSS